LVDSVNTATPLPLPQLIALAFKWKEWYYHQLHFKYLVEVSVVVQVPYTGTLLWNDVDYNQHNTLLVFSWSIIV